MHNYLFESDRLGFRNWKDEDLEPMTAINIDPEVMQFFPSLQPREQTSEFISKMQKQFLEKGFTYFAVETVNNGEFIGFIGLGVPSFESDFTPCVDMGWRLKKDAQNKGYATEGAKRCLEYAAEIDLREVYAFAPVVNKPSENVMIKAGMKKLRTFMHPKLSDYPKLNECVLYHILTGATSAK